MKIIANNKVYVQKSDLAYLNTSDLPIPSSIYLKTVGNRFILDDSNRYDFISFEDEMEINFFKDQDWIFDYDEIKKLSEEEVIKLGYSISEEKDKLVKEFKKISKKEKKNNYDLISRCELLDYKLLALRDILFTKKGILVIPLPIEIENSKNNKVKVKKKFSN